NFNGVVKLAPRYGLCCPACSVSEGLLHERANIFGCVQSIHVIAHHVRIDVVAFGFVAEAHQRELVEGIVTDSTLHVVVRMKVPRAAISSAVDDGGALLDFE